MKRTPFFFLLFLAVGCTDAQRNAEASQRAQAKTETKEAAQAMGDYAFARKADFVQEMKKDLAAIEADMNRLGSQVEKSNGEAKADAKASLEAVRGKWAEAKRQLDLAENATETTWEDAKGGFKKVHADLKESVEKSRQWLSDKIAP